MAVDVQWSYLPWSALGVDALYEVLTLRARVFVVEQACAYLDLDGRDREASHLLGRRQGRLVAYLRTFGPDTDGETTIGRVITAPEARGIGLGRPLMHEGLRRLDLQYGATTVRISAQAHLAPFYESLGFETDGVGYDEDGIPHLPLARRPR